MSIPALITLRWQSANAVDSYAGWKAVSELVRFHAMRNDDPAEYWDLMDLSYVARERAEMLLPK